nr:hypothetical protein [Tanacetum cinerariifolium]
SIVASLENVNGFLVVYIPLDDLICTNFEKKGVVPENPMKQSHLGIFLGKEISEDEMIRTLNAFFMIRTAPIAKSLASHMSSKGIS